MASPCSLITSASRFGTAFSSSTKTNPSSTSLATVQLGGHRTYFYDNAVLQIAASLRPSARESPVSAGATSSLTSFMSSSLAVVRLARYQHPRRVARGVGIRPLDPARAGAGCWSVARRRLLAAQIEIIPLLNSLANEIKMIPLLIRFRGHGMKARLINPRDALWDWKLGVHTFGYHPAS